jgi:queuine tRNA-ribosyltransferase
VIQGGNDSGLRKRCAEELLEIGFDGFGFGGWPIDDEGRLVDMAAEVAGLVPSGYPLHALGVGSPANIITAWEVGYTMFDSTLPTRDARRRRLFVTPSPLDRSSIRENDFYKYLYIEDKKYIRDSRPVDENCSCPCCAKYSRGYLNHLFRAKEDLAPRLATLHNLTFYSKLMTILAGA